MLADFPCVAFDFTVDYTAGGPERFLKDYKGYLQADALAQYEGLFGPGKVEHVCCWARTRDASSWLPARAETSAPRRRWS
jgi:transposase